MTVGNWRSLARNDYSPVFSLLTPTSVCTHLHIWAQNPRDGQKCLILGESVYCCENQNLILSWSWKYSMGVASSGGWNDEPECTVHFHVKFPAWLAVPELYFQKGLYTGSVLVISTGWRSQVWEPPTMHIARTLPSPALSQTFFPVGFVFILFCSVPFYTATVAPRGQMAFFVIFTLLPQRGVRAITQITHPPPKIADLMGDILRMQKTMMR